MTDETTTSAEEPSREPGAAAGAAAGAHATDAWHEVIGQLDALGEAMGRWARAAVNDPQNQERAEELKDHMHKMAETVSDAVDDASKSDVGKQFKDAAYKTGEAFKAAGERVGEEVAPRVASAFRITAEKLHQAAERMERPEGPAAGEAPVADEPPAESGGSAV